MLTWLVHVDRPLRHSLHLRHFHRPQCAVISMVLQPFLLSSRLWRTSSGMPKFTKAELRARLEALGELAPSEWTVVELKTRVAELESEQGIQHGPRQAKTPLRQMIRDMNVASKKKADLQAYLTVELGMTLQGTETLERLQRMGLMQIYQKAEVSPQDPVGFGRYSQLTYLELKSHDEQYCTWAKQTHREGTSDYRLSRFAQWLENYTEKKMTGNQRAGHPPPPLPVPSSAASSLDDLSSHPVDGNQTGVSGKMMSVLRDVTTALKVLQEEVTGLRGHQAVEPPRKKEKAETEDSFEKVTSPK